MARQMTGRFLALLLAGGLLGTLSACKNITEGQAEEGAVGAECSSKGDCDQVSDPVCLKMPSGYCSAECSGDLFDCDDQSVCDQLGDQAFYCLDGCLTENGDGDCRAEYRCAARPDVTNSDGREVGVCVPSCQSDSDCEAGRRCDTSSGNCVAKGSKATGDACTSNSSCNGGLCVENASFRGGYCSARCGSQFADCEQGSHCATVDSTALCLTSCSSDSDCRGGEGYKCREIRSIKDQDGDSQAVKVCVPKCQSNDECDDGTHCNTESGECEDGVGEPNPLGQFCDADADCETGECLTGDAWPKGYCSEACSDGCAACDGAGEFCLAACNSDLDCRGGYVCNDGGCVGACTGDSDCSGDQRCNKSSGKCYTPGSGTSQIITVDIANNVSVGEQFSEDLTLNVPEDALGFAIIAEGSGDDLMIIGQMTDPSGNVLYDLQDPSGGQARFFPSNDQITHMLPVSPRTAPTPGRYTFNLVKEGSTVSIDVKAIIKTGDGQPDSGSLDVNFFFANVSGLDADSAPNHTAFQKTIKTFRDVYASQGIELGTIHYCDLKSSDASRYSVIDSIDGVSSELSKMFALSSTADNLGCTSGPALNFFLVQEIVGGRAGYIILGIAGGIPGPPGLHGGSHSGVAVTMTGFESDPVLVGQTMAHEGGHYLGLFHTSEAEGTAFDPLPDTPECSSSFDDNSDGLVDFDECKGGRGSENLMFWAAGDGANDVSGDQGFVVLRNPAVE